MGLNVQELPHPLTLGVPESLHPPCRLSGKNPELGEVFPTGRDPRTLPFRTNPLRFAHKTALNVDEGDNSHEPGIPRWTALSDRRPE